jgi:hypothetical protein
MIGHLYLPSLERDKSPKVPAATGKWESYNERLLLDVSNGIVIDEQARVRGVSSVPDIWGRPLMFASALRQHSQHPLRGRLLQEWRGLLSLMALSRIQTYDLEYVGVPLDSGKFSAALKRLVPRPVALEARQAYSWTNIVMMRYERIPIGALSPSTLVYTATDYAPRLVGTKLHLKDESGYLKPPDHPEEKFYVAEWVSELQRRLTGILNADEGNHDRAAVLLINALLADWLTELRRDLGIAADRPIDSPEVEVDEDPATVDQGTKLLATHRVYRELLRPLRNVDDPGKQRRTDLWLNSKRNLSPYKHVVVVTRGLISGSARIWDKKRLTHLGGDLDVVLKRHFSDPKGFGQTLEAEDLRKHQAMWIRPERYFLSDVLLKAADGGAFVGDYAAPLNGDRRFVLPFRKEILDYFSAEDLRDLDPEFVRESDQSITFRFSLPVANASEKVEKTYKYKNAGAGEGEVREIAVPVVEVFPRYLDPTWRRYYVFHGAASLVQVNPVVTAGGDLSVTSRVHQDPATLEKVRITVTSADTHVDSEAPSRLPFPEALEFASADGHSAFGLMLLPRPEELGGRSGSWRIGVDFGTSNTNVWVHEGSAADARAWRMRFDEYLQPITTAVPSAAKRTEGLFLPNIGVDLPVPTTLKIHVETQREMALLDYFPHLPAPSDRADRYHLSESVKSDLKWEDEDRKTPFFLESVLLMLLVEAAARRVNKITLACSYPKAFSQDKINLLKLDWDAVIKKLLQGPDRLCDSDRMLGAGSSPRLASSDTRATSVKLDGPKFEVEGIAAGEFFASDRIIKHAELRADKTNGAICLDVGGGTTDISVWFREEIVFDASIMLAGRQISELLRGRPRVLELLFSSDAVAALHETKDYPNGFAARLNIILRKEEAQIQDQLIRHANVPELRAFRRLLVFEFGAITFYACTVLAAADRLTGEGRLLRKLTDSGINLHWGGNAAKFINWIDFGRYNPDGVAAKVLNAIAFQVFKEAGATVPAGELAQRQSAMHKSEAAGGLAVMSLGHYLNSTNVNDYEMNDNDGKTSLAGSEGLVCGENIELTTGKRDYLSLVSERDLFKDKKTLFERTTVERLKRFIDILNHFSVRFGLNNNEGQIDLERKRPSAGPYATTIANQTRSIFVRAERKQDGQRVIEPVFILEVKLLLEMLAIDLLA